MPRVFYLLKFANKELFYLNTPCGRHGASATTDAALALRVVTGNAIKEETEHLLQRRDAGWSTLHSNNTAS